MTKRRVRPPGSANGTPPGVRRGGAKSSAVTSSWWAGPRGVATLAGLAVLAALGPALLVLDTGGGKQATPSDTLTWQAGKALLPKANGGWRLPDAETERRLGGDVCNIPRVSVRDLSPERFQREFRFKRPVIVTFPGGAAEWTDPHMWGLDYLNRSYGQWGVGQGSSMEIVRRGGNGYDVTSFSQFLDRIAKYNDSTQGPDMYYIFDREFFYDTNLVDSFRLPPFFSHKKELQDSIFFLGASGSGVVFHKHSDTWNGVVFGQKRWFLYPMHRTPPGGVYHGYTITEWYEKIYPNLEGKQRPLECVQRGGEILYLPEGFYHATLNVGDTVAVALQTKEPELIEEKITYEITDVTKQLDRPGADNEAINRHLLTLYLKLLDLVPDSSEVNMKLGERYSLLGEHETAVKLLQRAIELDPYFVFAFTWLGTTLDKLGRKEEAESALRRAVELSPEVWDVHKEFAMFLMHQGRWGEAIPSLKKGAELSPENSGNFLPMLQQAQTISGDKKGARDTALRLQEFMDSRQDGEG